MISGECLELWCVKLSNYNAPFVICKAHEDTDDKYGEEICRSSSDFFPEGFFIPLVVLATMPAYRDIYTGLPRHFRSRQATVRRGRQRI
jgi:hypothetical protein